MSAYVRPQWTGKPAQYTDGQVDLEFSECPSCLSFHATSYIGCNGKREPSDRRCDAVLGEIQCDRPDNHLEAHEARSSAMKVTWEVTLPLALFGLAAILLGGAPLVWQGGKGS